MTFLVIKWVVNLFLFISVLCDKDVLFDNLYIFTTMKHLIRIFFKKVLSLRRGLRRCRLDLRNTLKKSPKQVILSSWVTVISKSVAFETPREKTRYTVSDVL